MGNKRMKTKYFNHQTPHNYLVSETVTLPGHTDVTRYNVMPKFIIILGL